MGESEVKEARGRMRCERVARREPLPDMRISGRWRMFSYDELMGRDKVGPGDNAHLPAPEVIAAEIMEDLRAALEQFAEIAS